MWVLNRVLARVIKSGGSGEGCTGADIEAFCAAGEPETVPIDTEVSTVTSTHASTGGAESTGSDGTDGFNSCAAEMTGE
jgi:hypothetical protein